MLKLCLRMLIIAAVLALRVSIASGRHLVMPLWPHLHISSKMHEDKSIFSPQYGKIILPAVDWPTLTVYPPPTSKTNHCAVIICPGGGYGSIYIHWEGRKPAQWLNRIGVTAFILKYRLPDGKLPSGGTPWALQDIWRAMRLVRANAKRFHINPQDIGVAGFSAGGSVASMAGVHWLSGNHNAINPLNRFSTRPNFMILCYPVISMMPDITNIPTRNNLLGHHPSLKIARYFSSELNVTRRTPPAFICYARNDAVVNPQNSIRFYKALKKHGVPAELRVYKTGGHGFSTGLPGTGTINWPNSCRVWLIKLNFLPKDDW